MWCCGAAERGRSPRTTRGVSVVAETFPAALITDKLHADKRRDLELSEREEDIGREGRACSDPVLRRATRPSSSVPRAAGLARRQRSPPKDKPEGTSNPTRRHNTKHTTKGGERQVRETEGEGEGRRGTTTTPRASSPPSSPTSRTPTPASVTRPLAASVTSRTTSPPPSSPFATRPSSILPAPAVRSGRQLGSQQVSDRAAPQSTSSRKASR